MTFADLIYLACWMIIVGLIFMALMFVLAYLNAVICKFAGRLWRLLI